MSYPRQLPITAVQQLVAYFQKTPGVSLQDVMEDAYDVLGFAMFTFEGSGRPLLMTEGPLTDAEKAQILQSLLPANNVQAANIPWAVIWAILQQLINEWLSKP